VNPYAIPVYLNVRDRVTDLKALVRWLEDAGHTNIILLDNDSSYEPLLDYLTECPHDVVRLGANYGSRSLWRSKRVPDHPFIYSDPDLIPIPECPQNAVERLWELFEYYPHPRVGLGLYLDDVPETLQSLQWEKSLVRKRLELEPGVFDSYIDTTFAIHRAKAPQVFPTFGIRTGFPYQMRHTPWYRISNPTEEEAYYLANAIKGPLGSSWAEGKQ